MDFHLVTNGTDETRPLLYQWEIHDAKTGELGNGSVCRPSSYTFVSVSKTMSSMLQRKSVTPASIAGVVLIDL